MLLVIRLSLARGMIQRGAFITINASLRQILEIAHLFMEAPFPLSDGACPVMKSKVGAQMLV